MGNRRSFIRKAAAQSAKVATLAGFVFIATQGAPASANDRMSFREFRQQNEGLAKSAARQLFRDQFGRTAPGESGANFGMTYQPNLQPVTFGAGGEPIFNSNDIAGLKRTHEPRVRNQSMQELSNGSITRVNRGVELDLGSNSKNIVLGRALFDTNETIEVSIGGKTETFSAGSKVTAAEYVAVKQILSGGGQQVEVDRSGRASGGSVDLGSLTADNDVMRASSLVVPENVTTYGDFGRGSDFRLSGDLSNFGTVQTLSTNTTVRGGAIHADNITNHSGALISGKGDLSLDAANNLVNYGVIAASGNLSLSAGHEVSNSGTVVSGNSLSVTSDNVVNRGSLNANSGDISFATTGGALLVDNRRGIISSNSGAINVRDAAFAGTANSYVVGGDLLSRELNLNSGLGTVNVNVQQLTGVVNETGTAAHVAASTDALNIGSVCLTGDPTFFNRTAYVNIVGNIDVAEDLTIVAATNIFSDDNITISAGDSSRGYNITMIAGAAFFSTSGSDVFSLGPITSPPYTTSGVVTITGGTKSGGGIYLGADNVISSRSKDLLSAGDRNGGNVEMFAFGKGEGQIRLDDTKIETGGVNLGTNGNVLIVSEHAFKDFANSGLWVNNIDTTNQSGGPQGAGGSVSLIAAKPTITGGTSVVYDAQGSRVGAARLVAGTAITPGSWLYAGPGSETDPLPSINASGDVTLSADYVLTPANIFAKNIDVTGITRVRADSGFLAASESISLAVAKKGNIGIESVISVFTPDLTIIAPGGGASVENIFVGTSTVSATAKNLGLYAYFGRVEGAVKVEENLNLVAGEIALAPISVKDTLSVTSLSTPLMDDGTRFNAPTLIVQGPQVGVSAANPFLVSSAVKKLAINADDAFVATAGTKKPLVLTGANVDNLTFNSTVGVTVTGNVSASETLTLQSSGKAITIGELAIVQAVDALNIINTGITKKDKIVIAKGAAIQTSSTTVGEGDILIQLGTAGGAAAPTPANVTANSNVQILGLGLTAKSPNNTLSGLNAGVTISNSVAVKNISLGGSVQVSAVAP